MAGLLNIVPRYLPRYGMAPDWARATRPLVLIFTAICFVVTILFRADVDAQAGAYATGVLAVMTSAAVAVTLSARGASRRARRSSGSAVIASSSSTRLSSTSIGGSEGLQIAAVLHRRDRRHLARLARLALDRAAGDRGRARRDGASASSGEAARRGEIRAHRQPPGRPHHPRVPAQGARGAGGQPHPARRSGPLPGSDRPRCLRVRPDVMVQGEEIGGYRVLRVGRRRRCPTRSPPSCSHIRDRTGKQPHAYFGWTEGNPLKYLARFILFGEGDIAPVTHEILRQAEPDPHPAGDPRRVK